MMGTNGLLSGTLFILTGVRHRGKAASPPLGVHFARGDDIFLVTTLPGVISNTHSLTRNLKIRSSRLLSRQRPIRHPSGGRLETVKPEDPMKERPFLNFTGFAKVVSPKGLWEGG